jgi:hypothetical protein
VLGSTKGRILSYFFIETDDEQNTPWLTLGQIWAIVGPAHRTNHVSTPSSYHVIDHLSDVSG